MLIDKFLKIILSPAETNRAVAENKAKIYNRMVSLCIRLGKPDEAISFAERGKSRTLIEMLHAAQLQPSENVSKEIREAFLEVRDKLEELRLQQEIETKQTCSPLVTGESDEKSSPMHLDKKHVLSEDLRQQIDEAQKTYESLLDEIRKLDPEFAASERVQPISIDEIQAMIPQDTVFVECFTGYDGTYVFVLDSESDVRDTYLVLKNLTSDEMFNNLAIQNWLKPYYDYLSEEDFTQGVLKKMAWFKTIENTPKLLAEQFWYAKDETGKSLASLVDERKPKRIVFIPHSGLHLLPLHLIPLRPLRKEKRGVQGFLAPALFAVANPDKSLAFTDSEVEAIAKHFENPRILWHEHATKEAILSEPITASITHFSCHGNFQYANPLDSHLILADDNLTLKEIFAKLKLPDAEAVVLSACETGMVQLERGDEYVGLASGFMYAGAPSVISSLWAVPDFSTSLLMQRFYDNILTKKMGKAAALREAQQWLRNLTAKEIRTLIENFIQEIKKQAPSEKSQLNSFNFMKGRYEDSQDDEKPFAHPYHWGAFLCNGNRN